MRGLGKNKRKILLWTLVSVVLIALFVLSDAILQQNTLQLAAKGDQKQGEFGHLLSWLPKDAKESIEYRAKYLFLQNKMNRAKDPDEKVNNIFIFADYIKGKDYKGSDAMLAGVVNLPEYKRSRRAYPVYARLLLNERSSRKVTIKELHDYLDSLVWPEDDYEAWSRIFQRLYEMRAYNEVFLEVTAPLLKKQPEYRNYERFYNDIEKRAISFDEPLIAAKAAAICNEVKKKPWAPSQLLQAPLSFRNDYADLKKGIAKADKPDLLVSLLNSLAVLTREKNNDESNAIFARLLDTPELATAADSYVTYANLLLFTKNKRSISIEKYHEILHKIDEPRRRYMAWESGFRQLRMLKAKPQVMFKYLSPLAAMDVKYLDYSGMFRELAACAKELGKTEVAKKADDFLVKVQDTYMPSLMNIDETEESDGEKE